MKIFITYFLLLISLNSVDLYDPLKSPVQKITQQNWTNNVSKGIQNNKIFLIHFYNPNDGKSYEFSKIYEEKA